MRKEVVRNAISICKQELLTCSVSPASYVFFAGFFAVAGYFFLNLLASFNTVLAKASALPVKSESFAPSLNALVVEPYFHTVSFLLVFFVPLLTMRSVAEERENGILEFLRTLPISPFAVALGKLFAFVVSRRSFVCFQLLISNSLTVYISA